MISLDFEWQTNEFMLYCRSTQLREKTMSSYEQTLHLFGRWLADELKIYTVDKITENVIRKYIDDLMVRGKCLVDKVIREHNLSKSKLCCVLPSGGWSQMLKLHHDMVTYNTLGVGKHIVSIFDGDANRHFWARGYFVDTVGKNKKQIQEYIRNQLTSDQIADQMSLKEFVDPFTGRENQKA